MIHSIHHSHRMNASLLFPNRWRFVIHGGIDGYSRMVVFLKCSNNNKAATVFESFLRSVQVGSLSTHRSSFHKRTSGGPGAYFRTSPTLEIFENQLPSDMSLVGQRCWQTRDFLLGSLPNFFLLYAYAGHLF